LQLCSSIFSASTLFGRGGGGGNIWIFANLPFFADYCSRAQGLSKNASNVIDVYHNKKIEGG